jgi:hypothetical protein
MTSKTLFTDDEWHILEWAVTDTMTYVSLAEASFWATFKEATAAAKFMAHAKADTSSPLVHDLAGSVKLSHDKRMTHDKAHLAEEAVKRIHEAKKLVAAKSPDDLDAFKAFLMGVAQATADASKGVGPHEQEALRKIEGALG